MAKRSGSGTRSDVDPCDGRSPTIIGLTPPKPTEDNSARRLLNFDSVWRFQRSRGEAGGMPGAIGSASGSRTRETSGSNSSVSVSNTPTSSTSNSSMDQILAELRKSNAHMKELTNRMDDVDKRLKSVEEGDADDEGDGPVTKKKKQRHKSGPSKEIRVCRLS